MLIIAFVAFVVLLLAWLIAPNGEVERSPAAAPAPQLKVGDVPA